MEIKFKGSYDKEIFFKAVRLANRPARSQVRSLVVMAGLALVAIGILIYRVYASGDFLGILVLLLAAIVLGGAVSWPYIRTVFTARKLWANPGTRRALKGEITNQGVRYVLDAGTNSIQWDHFIRVRRSQDFVALVRKDGLLVIFQKSFFKNNADWRKFNRLVDLKLYGLTSGS